MRYCYILATIIILIGVTLGCADENEEKDVNRKKYIMSIKSTGDLIIDDKIIGSIDSPADTIDQFLNSEESFSFFVPDTLYLLPNNLARIKYSDKRPKNEGTPSKLDSLNLKYKETETKIIVYSDVENGELIFEKESGKIYIQAEVVNIYRTAQLMISHFRFTSLHGSKFGIGKWPNIVTKTDTIQYYSIRFEYN